MGLPQLLEFTGRNKINLYAKGDIQDCVKLYNTVSKLAYISFRVTFAQKGPEDVAELEELRSWDHELHFTKILLGHGRKHASCKILSYTSELKTVVLPINQRPRYT